MSLSVVGAEALAQDLRSEERRLSRPVKPLLQGAAALMQTWMQDHIRSEQGPDGPWPALHPATRKIREYYGWPAEGPRLIRAGDLLHSIETLSQTDSEIEVGSRLSYARLVQLGGEVQGRGRPRTIQAFPFVYFSPSEIDDLVDTITTYFFEEA